MSEPVVLAAIFIDGLRHAVRYRNLVVQRNDFFSTFDDPCQYAFTGIFIQVLTVIFDVGLALDLGVERNHDQPPPGAGVGATHTGQVVGEQAGVPVFEKGNQAPVKTCEEAIRYARDYGHDIMIIDTAGRLQIDEELMNELREIKEKIGPHEILLVVDSMTGQEAVNVAKTFDELLEINGVILTKLDGDTRGGAALSIRAVTGKPIKFVGVGEKLDNLEVFHPDRMASRILGMGDVLTLIEDAQSKIDEKAAEEAAQKILQNKFDLNDLLNQFAQVRKMGPLKSVISKLPGMDKQLKDVDVDDRQMDRMEAIILSMTEKERQKPDIINPSRKRRIAAGSGMKVEDVNRLLKQFETTQKLMRQMRGKKGKRRPMMPPGMGGMGGMGGF